MIVRVVEGTYGMQGTVSGTDQTVVALTNPEEHTASNILRVWVENPTELTVKESDDVPTVSGVNTIIVDVGSLTDEGGGQVRLTSSGTVGDVITTATGTFTESLTVSGEPVATGTGGITDHAALSNLEFASSGHTGFASSAEVDADIATHAAITDAHHAKYTNAEAITATEASRYTLSGTLSTEIDDDITTHAGVTNAHHTKYTDAEANSALEPTTGALAASGVATDVSVAANTTLITTTSGHLQSEIDGIEPGEGVAANALVGSDGITVTSGDPIDTISGFHTEFVAASGTLSTQITDDIATHDAITDAHHTKYTDAEAITALEPTTSALAASGVATDANLVSVSGHLQSEIDAVDDHPRYTDSEAITALEPTTSALSASGVATDVDVALNAGDIAALTTSGITQDGNISTNAVDISALTASGIVQDANLVSVSGHLQNEIDAVEGSDVDSVNTFTGDIIIAGAGGNTIINDDPTITISGFHDEFVAASGFLDDHGNLGGLGDDDHLQYHNDVRGDIRYYTQDQLLSTASGSPGSSLVGFPTASGFSSSVAGDEPTLFGAQSFFFSSGWVSGGEITDAGGETIAVASGIGAIRNTDTDLAPLFAFGWNAVNGISIAVQSTRFIGVSFVNDTASIVNRSSNTWNYNTEFPLGLVTNRESELTIIPVPHVVGDLAKVVNRRFEEVEGARRADAQGGMILSESADTNRNVSVTAGVLWFKLNRFTTSAIDTSGSDTFDSYYEDGVGGFTKVANETQWDNTSYDNGSGVLAPLTNNRFANLWFYLEVSGGLSCVYGRLQSNKLADVELEPVPDPLPPGLTNSILLGRIIFFKNDTTATDVQTAFDTNFTLSGASDHGSLAGLTDDDHLQYTREDGTRGFSATVSGVAPVDSDDLSTKNYVDGEIVTVSGHLSAEIDNDITTHAGISDAHHTKYTDGEAVSATESSRYTMSGTLSSEIDSDISTHAAISTAHHTKYTDAEAVIALEPTTSELAASGVTTDEQVTTNYTAFLNASGTLVKKTGDTMTGELIAPTVTVSESLTISGSPVCTGIPYVRDITVEVPGEDEDLTYFFTKQEIAVDSLQAVVVGSGVGFGSTWTVRHDPERWESGTELVTGGTTTTNSGVGDTINSFDSSTIPSDSWVWVETTAFTPVVNLLTISLEGKKY